MNTTVFIKYL